MTHLCWFSNTLKKPKENNFQREVRITKKNSVKGIVHMATAKTYFAIEVNE